MKTNKLQMNENIALRNANAEMRRTMLDDNYSRYIESDDAILPGKAGNPAHSLPKQHPLFHRPRLHRLCLAHYLTLWANQIPER